MKLLLLVFAVSWLDGGHLAPITKPRPTPIEPDKPNHDFREPVKPTWHADQNGFWWVQGKTQRYGDLNSEVVKPYGYPINMN